MKRIVFTCLFNFLVLAGFTQDIRLDIDSLADNLKHELAISKPDTNRVLILVQLINAYKFYTPDSAFFYGQKALELARKIKFPKGEAKALDYLALTYRTLGNSSKALELEFKSIQIADKNNLVYEKANALTDLAFIYLEFKNYSKALFYQHQAINLYPEKSGNMALGFNILADTYLSMNKLDSAEYYSRLATNYIKQYNVDWLKPYNLRTIAGIYNKKGENTTRYRFLPSKFNE